MSNAPEVWLRGPIDGIAPVLQPAAHALVQAAEDVTTLGPAVSSDLLWRSHGAATAGFHLIHLAGALDRIYTYARGESLDDAQRAAAKGEGVPQPSVSGAALAAVVSAAVDRALAQLRATSADDVFAPRRVGRAGLPSTVLGLLFHGAEHTTRHVGQFITTVKLLEG